MDLRRNWFISSLRGTNQVFNFNIIFCSCFYASKDSFIAFTNYINLSAQDRIYEMVQKEVETVNETLPAAQQIRKFLLLDKQLDSEDGELTRTRKVRRGVIKEKYAEIIDTIYSDQDVVHIDTVITFQDGNKSRVQTDVRIVDLVSPSAAKEAV